MSTVTNASAHNTGERIARVREKLKWSRRQLALDAGVSHQYIGEIERGEAREVGVEILERIARALKWRSFDAMMSTDALEPPPSLRRTDDSLTPVASDRGAGGDSGTLVPVEGHAQGYRSNGAMPRVVQAPAIPSFGTVLLPVVPQTALNANSITDLGGGHVQTADFVAVPTELTFGRVLRAVRVEGSCMAPEINSGDVVLVELGRIPLDGEVVAVEYEGRALIKVWWNEGDHAFLEANRDGDSLTVHKRDVTVLGVVVNGVYTIPRHQRRLRRAG